MPRYARLHAPGTLVHVIARFVNRQFRLETATARAALLDRLPRALARCDWRLYAYAMMSNHVHLALLAGLDPPARLLGPLNTSIARWLNRAQGTFGPVFAQRATTIYMDASQTALLAAYLHNNPVRAGLVVSAADSSWTSHGAWIGRAARPDWLAASQGLEAAGFSDTPEGRRAFDRFVRGRAGEPVAPEVSGHSLGRLRKRVRTQTGLPVEVSSLGMPAQDPAQCQVLYPTTQVPAERWEGELVALLELVAGRVGVSMAELCSPSKRRKAVGGRRVALVTGAWLLRRRQVEVAAALGLSSTAASQLLQGADAVMPLALELAAELRGHEPSQRRSPRADMH